MSVVHCAIVPHPPIAVPEVGKAESEIVKDTQQAMLALAERIKASGAEVMVMISPHSPVFADAIAVHMTDPLTGNLARFGAANVSFSLANHRRLATAIIQQCGRQKLVAVELDQQLAKDFDIDLSLDHGAAVPLYFFAKAGLSLPLVLVSPAMFGYEQLYHFGLAVEKAAAQLGVKVALVASGDLSHRLTPNAPAGFHPEAVKFDQRIVELVQRADAEGLVQIDYEQAEQAGECGLRPIIMMMGALDGRDVHPELLCYQGPFGVGYMVASLTPGAANPQRRLREVLEQKRLNRLAGTRQRESFIVRCARESLENHVLGQPPPVYNRNEIPAEFNRPGASFVTIKKHGRLRGCIGSVLPQRATVVEEVMQNAISAGMRDPRFDPVEAEELPELTYSVDILTPPQPVDNLAELDPKVYGVIVRSGHRSGLLLPDLAGVETVQQQLDIARQKAGIGPTEKITVEKFEVIRYT